MINFARTGPELLILTLIRQIQEAKVVLEELVTLLRSIPVGRDTFASHLYRSRREDG
ncbi:MAG TPA: hypothetical protein VM574_09645 [Terrimicrobiaceae bacterium]|nr:hypothetical protein [Terrimicrobiaceae bacterium]